LSQQPPDEKPTRALDVILRNARAQKRIIEDLLDMSQMLSGNLRLDLHRLDLRAVLDAAHETAKLTADAKRVRLSFDHGNAEALVLGDAGRLQQVIWNLLANAIKFTPSGGPDEDGYALLRRIRALGSAKNAALPAVAVTAYTATEERARALSAGFRSYVTKPFDVAELCAMIAAATGRLGA
jgi:CheY-like chemotaxis protein